MLFSKVTVQAHNAPPHQRKWTVFGLKILSNSSYSPDFSSFKIFPKWQNFLLNFRQRKAQIFLKPRNWRAVVLQALIIYVITFFNNYIYIHLTSILVKRIIFEKPKYSKFHTRTPDKNIKGIIKYIAVHGGLGKFVAKISVCKTLQRKIISEAFLYKDIVNLFLYYFLTTNNSFIHDFHSITHRLNFEKFLKNFKSV